MLVSHLLNFLTSGVVVGGHTAISPEIKGKSDLRRAESGARSAAALFTVTSVPVPSLIVTGRAARLLLPGTLLRPASGLPATRLTRSTIHQANPLNNRDSPQLLSKNSKNPHLHRYGGIIRKAAGNRYARPACSCLEGEPQVISENGRSPGSWIFARRAFPSCRTLASAKLAPHSKIGGTRRITGLPFLFVPTGTKTVFTLFTYWLHYTDS